MKFCISSTALNLILSLGIAAVAPQAGALVPTSTVSATPKGSLPFVFEANHGQFPKAVKFLTRGKGFDAFLTDDGPHIVLGTGSQTQKAGQGHRVVRMKFLGSRQAPEIQGVSAVSFKTSYFKGGERAQSIVGIDNFEKVRSQSVYPGIDVLYYGNEGEFEYDFEVAPGANPSQISIRYDGANSVALDKAGNLIVKTQSGALVQHRPVAYQTINGERRLVESSYRLDKQNRIAFAVGHYERAHTLIIDPILSYATFVWGAGDSTTPGTVRSVAVDSGGNAYVVGSTTAADFPVAGSYQSALAGTRDAYILKMDPSGTKIVYATYLGGRRANTYGDTISVDTAGNAYITGTITACALPLTTSPMQATCDAASNTKPGFITKLNPTGTALVFSTYFNRAKVVSTAVNSTGNLFLYGKGELLSGTSGAFQTTSRSGSVSSFVAKLNATGRSLMYLTHLGGSPAYYSDNLGGIAVDSSGNAVVTGNTYTHIVIHNSAMPLAHRL